MALAAFALTVVGCLIASVAPSYDGRLLRDAARAPVYLTDGADGEVDPVSSERAVARWHWRTEHIDFAYVDVVVLGSYVDSAPPPPGLERWPRPGEVFASAGVLRLDGADAFISRYGRLAGEIAPGQLADPGERFVIAGADPAAMDPDRTHLIGGFGAHPAGGDEGYLGSAAYQQSRTGFSFGLALFGAAPALVLSVVVLNLDAERRRRRLTLLRLLGARPGQVRGAVMRELIPPAAAGAAAAAALALLATAGTWQLPGMHYWVVGADLRGIRWAVPLVAAGSVTWLLAAGVFSFRTRRTATLGARPVLAPLPAARWPVVILAVTVVASNAGYRYLYPIDPGVSTMVAIGGATVCIVLLGSACATVIRWSAARLLGRTRGSHPVRLIAGRDLSVLSRPAVRATVGVAVIMVLAVQVSVWTSIASADQRVAEARVATDQGLSLVAAILPGAEELGPILVELPGAPHALVTTVPASGTPTVHGPCAVLMQVVGACEGDLPAAPVIRQALLWLPDGTQIDVVDDLAALASVPSASLLMFSSDGRPLDQDAIAAAFNRHVPAPISIERPGQAEVTGGRNYTDQGRWFDAGGLLGLMIIVATAGFSLSFEVLRLARRVAPLGVLVGAPRFYVRLAAGMIGIPLVATTVGGLVVATGLVLAPTAPDMQGELPVAAMGRMLGITGVASAVVVLLCARALADAAARWRGGDDTD